MRRGRPAFPTRRCGHLPHPVYVGPGSLMRFLASPKLKLCGATADARPPEKKVTKMPNHLKSLHKHLHASSSPKKKQGKSRNRENHVCYKPPSSDMAKNPARLCTLELIDQQSGFNMRPPAQNKSSLPKTESSTGFPCPPCPALIKSHLSLFRIGKLIPQNGIPATLTLSEPKHCQINIYNDTRKEGRRRRVAEYWRRNIASF